MRPRRTPPAPDLPALVSAALAEDVGPGDVTTAATVSGKRRGRARIVARAPGVVAGVAALAETYRQVGSVELKLSAGDGDGVEPGRVVATAEGSYAALLVAERTGLNFLQRLSGVATLTARFVDRVRGTEATIVDTRKTTPGWRALEKAAVVAGGGSNHRMGLWDAVLIKENHVAAAGGLRAALEAVAAKAPGGIPVEIEVRSLDELSQATSHPHPPDRVLCDNFPVDDLVEAVRRVREADPTMIVEASGNVTLETVRAIAETGVDWISVGALTHSAPALDLSCLIDPA